MNTKQLDAVTRRLQGRHFATIDDVVGVPGQAPAIVITWSDALVRNFYTYDNLSEHWIALNIARQHTLNYSVTHDVIDNTL